LGIDPGYALLGYAVIESQNLRHSLKTCGVVKTDAETAFSSRLLEIYNKINLIFEEFIPDLVSIESIYFQNNQKTAIYVAHARGVVILAAKQHNAKIVEYTPLQVKIALTGYGKAVKQQIILMTQKILKLQSPPKPDDAADAIALAICAAGNIGSMSKIPK
jgi:crossover junction endodeoxyribonuclease RuvC